MGPLGCHYSEKWPDANLFALKIVCRLKKVLCVLGTRPKSIKIFPVVRRLLDSKSFDPRVLCVYQQTDLLKQTLKFFSSTQLIEVTCPRTTGDLIELTTILLTKLGELFRTEKPDLILVQGDTSTAACASLSAFYLGIPIGHIEAGLRTFNPRNPFPEEAHRSIITHVAQWHFCPSSIAYHNVLQCGVKEDNVLLSGNTVIDALQSISAGSHFCALSKEIKSPYFVITAHRRENRVFIPTVFERLVASLLSKFPSHQVIRVTHPSWSNELIAGVLPDEARFLKMSPLPYEQFIGLLTQADLVLTDSGGVQEEITSLGIPGIILRTITDRPESLNLDFIKVLGWSIEQINQAASDLLKLKSKRSPFKSDVFGDGKAAERIVAFLENVNCT